MRNVGTNYDRCEIYYFFFWQRSEFFGVGRVICDESSTDLCSSGAEDQRSSSVLESIHPRCITDDFHRILKNRRDPPNELS